MEAIRRHTTAIEDGEIVVTGLPLKKGQEVEVILLTDHLHRREPVPLTARRLLQSGLAGIWSDRSDISDGATFARQLRDAAQNRRGSMRGRR
jgi:hypothetical protein